MVMRWCASVIAFNPAPESEKMPQAVSAGITVNAPHVNSLLFTGGKHSRTPQSTRLYLDLGPRLRKLCAPTCLCLAKGHLGGSCP